MVRKLLISLALCAVTLGLFAPVETYPFITLDDDIYVTGNANVLAGLNGANVVWAFRHVVANNWHPLTTLSLMLDATVFGNWAGGFHVTNVVMHSLNTVLLFLLLERMTGALWRSALVAALFAWHPLHVEPVAWISSRKDVLSTLFMMLAMMAYVRYAATRRRGPYLLVLVLFALGLMAKPMLVTLPFLLLLLDYWPLGRLRLGQNMPAPPGSGSSTQPVPLKALVLEKVPLLLVSAVFSVVAFIAQGDAVSSLQQFPLSVRLANIPISYVRYLRKLFWPDDLAIFYPISGAISLGLIAGVTCCLLLVSILLFREARRHPYAPVGWFWFLITLVPVIGIVQVGSQAMADRYSYVPSIGIFLIVAWGLVGIADLLTLKPEILALPACLALVGVVTVTRDQLKYWEDSERLFTHALNVTRGNVMARISLGRALANDGLPTEARQQYLAALAIDPNNPDSHNNLANVLFQDGQFDEAIRHYRIAIAHRSNFAIAHNNLGAALARKGLIDDAIAEFRTALRIDPEHAGARENLQKALELKGRTDR